MNKQDAMKRIEAIEAEAAALRKMVQEGDKPAGLWKPSERQAYWCVDAEGDAEWSEWDGDSLDCGRLANGNVFTTREAAEKAAPLFARAHKIIQAALMADPDAGEFRKDFRIWSVLFSTGKGKWVRFDSYYTDCSAAYVHTQQQAEHMAEILNAEGV